ncbi:MAG: hypothetical protein CL424_17795 [Acidimicrobiaceae bacterium]|nr:hypothetical protein [Acidimicrobiaceae bacterium]
MKKELWAELLRTLTESTKAGNTTWSPTDVPGSAIAAFDNASVTIRNVFPSTSPVTVGLIDRSHSIDLRDVGGRLVASLDNRNDVHRAAMGLDAAARGGTTDEFRRTTVADSELAELVKQLVGVIHEEGEAGSRAAMSIITELG